MLIDLPSGPLYAYTGGRPLAPQRPTVVFIHGVLNDHSVWILQTRYLAHHGFNVLAIDLPGHGRSGGAAPASVEEAAASVLALLDALQIKQAALVGHSWGSLIALHASATAPQRISHLALVGSAYPMRVAPALLQQAQEQPLQAIERINQYSHSSLASGPSVLGPGTWLRGCSRALMRRVLASNPQTNLLQRGFAACDRYDQGLQALQRLSRPVLFILGQHDQMTPPKAAQSLIEAAPAGSRVLRLAAGHALMSEAPEAVLQGLRDYLPPP